MFERDHDAAVPLVTRMHLIDDQGGCRGSRGLGVRLVTVTFEITLFSGRCGSGVERGPRNQEITVWFLVGAQAQLPA